MSDTPANPVGSTLRVLSWNVNGLRARWTAMVSALGVPAIDREGCLQIVELGPLVIANVYFPNGSGVNPVP